MIIINKILNMIWRFETWAITILLGLMVSITFVGAANRFTVAYPMPWTQEIVRYMFLWCTMFAASKGIRENAHVGINVFTEKLPPKLRKIAVVISVLISIFICIIFLRVGMIQTQNNLRQISPVLRINVGYVYSGLVVGGILMTISWLSVLTDTIKDFAKPE